MHYVLGFPGDSGIKNLLECRRPRFSGLGREDLLEMDMQLTPIFLTGEFNVQRLLEASYSPWVAKSQYN